MDKNRNSHYFLQVFHKYLNTLYDPIQDDIVLAMHDENYTGYTEITADFYRSAIGGILLSSYYGDFGRFGHKVHNLNENFFCILCSSDNLIVHPIEGFTLIVPANSTDEFKQCGGVIDYDVKMCAFNEPDNCEIDWQGITVRTNREVLR